MGETEKRQDTEGRALKMKGDRRAFLAGAAGAAVGATAATLLPQTARRAHAQVGEPLLIGQNNDGDALATSLSASLKAPVPGPLEQNGALVLYNTASGVAADERAWALAAQSSAGGAVFGITFGDPAEGGEPAGVEGMSGIPGPFEGVFGPAVGVRGVSGTGPGVHGESQSGKGLEGVSQSGFGVEGRSQSASGLRGRSESWIGAEGFTFSGLAGVVGWAPGETPGVIAHSQPAIEEPLPSDGGLALLVSGRAAFLTAGSSEVPARSVVASVANPAVKANSHITVTFTGNPGRASVAWVERQPGTGFIVHLSGRPRWAVPFTYLIVEPAA